MSENNNETTGLGTLVNRLGRTALGALENRGELLAVEWQEEKSHLIQLVVLAVALLFLGMLGMLALSATIIFLFAPEYRVYAAAGFTLLYLVGAVAVFLSMKSLLKHEPFSESLKQIRKDRTLLDVFE
jgi:uncharacterized membrane protein YqjE